MKKVIRKPKSKLPSIYVDKGHRYKWPIEVYKEWFEYCQLATDLPTELDADSFDMWFKPELFEEPMHDTDIKVLKQTQNKLTVEIDLTFDLHRLGMSFLKLMHKNKKTVNKESSALYHPSQSKKDMKLEAIKQARVIYVLKQQGMKNLEVANEVGLITNEIYSYKVAIKNKTRKETDFDSRKVHTWETTYKNAVRTIQRNIKLAENILINIENGTFP